MSAGVRFDATRYVFRTEESATTTLYLCARTLRYKHGAGEVTLELPAGTFEGESPEVAGRRELAEETGWAADDIRCIAEFFDDASKNTNMVHCLVALGARKMSNQTLDENEASSGVEIVEVSIDEMESLIDTGRIKAQSSVAAAYRVLSWLRDNFRADFGLVL
jgi:ADP-ribose pyrophosphatase